MLEPAFGFKLAPRFELAPLSSTLRPGSKAFTSENNFLGYARTKADKFENATFFIRIDLPSTLKRRFRCPKTEPFENALQSG